jgi:hypothetical protein
MIIVCDRCDWGGDIKEFDAHLVTSPDCDYRDECCKSEDFKDLASMEDICPACDQRIADWCADFQLDLDKDRYYE